MIRSFAMLALLLLITGLMIRCSWGAEATVVVAWNRMADHDETVVYRLWRGIELLGETAETRLEVSLPTDQVSTLTCTAHRGELSSAHSQPLTLAPAVVHSSPDMRVWVVERSSYFFQTLEREGAPVSRQFFRIQYHTP